MSDEVIELLRNLVLKPNTKARKRKIIFWYDPKQEYAESVDEIISSDDIEIIKLTELIKFSNNSFKIRYHIENEIPDKNVIIYIPFDRPKPINNPLYDLESSNLDYLFNPDKTTMLLKEFNLSDEFADVIRANEKFFNRNERKQKFIKFNNDVKTVDNINSILVAILVGSESCETDAIIKRIIACYYEEKETFNELFKWGNKDYILDLINNYFGSDLKDESDEEIITLLESLIFTYFASDVDDINQISRFNKYILRKIANVRIFVNSLKNDKDTNKYFEIISEKVVKDLGIEELIKTLDFNHYISNDAFKCIDNVIINYLADSLNSDVGQFNNYRELISLRASKYWYTKCLKHEYDALSISCDFLESVDNCIKKIRKIDIDEFSKLYTEELYKIDTLYRKFNFNFDKVEITEEFDKLKEKIENIYVNRFIRELSIDWSDTVSNLSSYNSNRMVLQDRFFDNYIKEFKDKKNRVIVIISDAFRYELAKELNYKLNEFGGKSIIEYMQGLVPSYTKLGMASLLPHENLKRVVDSSNKITDDILVDGNPSSSIEDREKILKNRCEESFAIKYEDLISKTKPEWKKLFSGQRIVYIYHDTVDNTGEHNESKVFDACDNAINEIYKLIEDLHKTFSGVELFVTADHGFFYKKSKLESSDKTKRDSTATKQKTRYSYSKEKSSEEGILSINLDYIFGKDSGYVNVPKGNSVYERQGSGFNYIHGGFLPEEIIIPVINFKSTRNIEEAKKVTITYSDISTKITNSIVRLHFVQDMKVDENHREARYKVHFEDDKNNIVSDEVTIVANSTSDDVKDRFFEEKFVFKNIKYDNEKDYKLVIIDEANNVPDTAKEVKFKIDIAIQNTFDF